MKTRSSRQSTSRATYRNRWSRVGDNACLSCETATRDLAAPRCLACRASGRFRDVPNALFRVKTRPRPRTIEYVRFTFSAKSFSYPRDLFHEIQKITPSHTFKRIMLATSKLSTCNAHFRDVEVTVFNRVRLKKKPCFSRTHRMLIECVSIGFGRSV